MIAPEDIRALLDRWYVAQNAKDFGFFEDLLADDIEWTTNGPGQLLPAPNFLNGKHAVLDAVKQLNAALHVVRNVVRDVLVDGDRVAVISDRTVMQRSTGRTLVYRVAAFMRFRDDKLVRYESFYDSFDMLEQVIGRPFDVPPAYPT